MATVGQNFVRRVSPECQNLSPSVVTAATIQLILIFIVLIILIIAAVYANFAKTVDGVDAQKKSKQINGMVIAAAVLVGITAIISIWNITISGRLKKCVEASGVGL